jgi:hypothetical protein
MRRRTNTLLVTVLAASMVAAAVVSLTLGRSPSADAQYAEYTIEILPGGFNPPTCQLNRQGSAVRFLNKDTKPRRIVVDGHGGSEEFFLDTGWIEPGAKNTAAWAFQGLDEKEYRDYDNPGLRGLIIVPIDMNAPSICAPLTPTPTPTNTATPTVTPTRSPTLPPTPIPQPTPPSCVRFLANPLGCLVAPWVSTDGPLY